MIRDFGDCDRCGKKDVPLIDGLCIECASKRKSASWTGEHYGYNMQYGYADGG